MWEGLCFLSPPNQVLFNIKQEVEVQLVIFSLTAHINILFLFVCLTCFIKPLRDEWEELIVPHLVVENQS